MEYQNFKHIYLQGLIDERNMLLSEVAFCYKFSRFELAEMDKYF